MSNLKDFLGGLDPATWTDAKAAYLDDNISTKAPASTALSTATWTSARATNLDNVDATVSSRAPSSTALSTATWTAARALNLDNIDTTVSSRAAASTALSTATWTNTRAGYLDTTISSRAAASTALSSNVWTSTRAGYIDNINTRLSSCSVQRLATRTYVTSVNDYDTWTISSVNTAKTFITANGVGLSAAQGVGLDGNVYGYEYYSDLQGTSVRLINATNIRYIIMGYQEINSTNSFSSVWNRWPGNSNNQFYAEFSAVQIS